jgi:hypothetical protein
MRLRTCTLLVCLTSLLLTLTLAAPIASARTRNLHYGMHSMLYLTSPPAFKEAMFAAAAAAGVGSIRVDVEIQGIVLGRHGARDWSGLDQYMALSREYGVQIEAVLLGTPSWASSCPPSISELQIDLGDCPPADRRQWAEWAGEIATHTRGTIDTFELINEPDGRWTYLGSSRQYGEQLTAAARAIRGADPQARIAIGGMMNPFESDRRWFDQVMSVPGAARSFDVANIHIRTRLASIAKQIGQWRTAFASHGFHGPMWVTETGYPSDRRHQYERGYQHGQRSQAAFLAQALPRMFDSGVSRVYVTERDNLGGAFASEGLLGGNVTDASSRNGTGIVAKSAFNMLAVAAGQPTAAESWSNKPRRKAARTNRT